MSSISEALHREMEEALKDKGMEGCRQLIRQSLDGWQNMNMKIGVIGLSGSGKSSLINALRDLNADQTGAAEVGSDETTTEPTEYPHPENKQLVLVDLPGVGTSKFPRDSYLDVIEVDQYDFFLLVAQKRFYEYDGWLTKELIQRKKEFFFVRTHIHNEVENDKKAHPSTHDKDQLIAGIRRKTEAELKKIFQDKKVPETSMTLFLIDNYEPAQYDFPAFREQLIDKFPELKREALLLTLRSATRSMLDEKVKCLRSRIWKAAALSGGVGLVPIPGTSFVADVAIIVHETQFYYQQLGLRSESLRRLAQETGVEFIMLENTVKQALGVNIMELGPKTIFTLIASLGIALAVFSAESVAEQVVAFIPVIGQIVAGTMSSVTTYWLLRQILDKMCGVAKKVLEVATGQLV